MSPRPTALRITQYELQFKKDDGDFATLTDDEDDDDTIVNRNDDADTDYSRQRRWAAAARARATPTRTSMAGATYTYRIRTVTVCNERWNYCGNARPALATALAGRTWSAEVVATSDAGPTADPVVPGTPVLSADANDDDNEIKLSWTKPSAGSSPIVSYQIQRWDGSAWEIPTHQPRPRGRQSTTIPLPSLVRCTTTPSAP